MTDHGLREIPGVTRHVREDLVARMKRAPIPKWVTRIYQPTWGFMDYCANDVVGSQWLNGSKELLVAGLAGPDSGCKYVGDFVTYRLDVASGNILQVYTAREAVRIFGDQDLPRVDPDEDEL